MFLHCSGIDEYDFCAGLNFGIVLSAIAMLPDFREN